MQIEMVVTTQEAQYLQQVGQTVQTVVWTEMFWKAVETLVFRKDGDK